MIDVKELRIGNYVSAQFLVNAAPIYETEIKKVTGLNENYVTIMGDVGMPIKSVSPVLLTEEWLLKFGFDENGQMDTTNSIYTVLPLLRPDNKPWEFMKDYEQLVIIFYVHQLQNIFYCLVGQELTIKERV